MNVQSMQSEIDRMNSDSITLRIAGQVTISSVGRLLLQLAGNLEHANEVYIDLSDVTEIDFAGLQLLCSCHRSSLFATKGYRITGQNHPAIWKAAAAIGKIRKQHCTIDPKRTCIWVGAVV